MNSMSNKVFEMDYNDLSCILMFMSLTFEGSPTTGKWNYEGTKGVFPYGSIDIFVAGHYFGTRSASTTGEEQTIVTSAHSTYSKTTIFRFN